MNKFIYGLLLSLICVSCRETELDPPINPLPQPPEQTVVNEGPLDTNFLRLRYRLGYNHQSVDNGRIWISEVGVNKNTGTIWVIGENLNVPCSYVRTVTPTELDALENSLKQVEMCRYVYAYKAQVGSTTSTECAQFLPTPSIEAYYSEYTYNSYYLTKLGECNYGPAACEESAAVQLVNNLNVLFTNDLPLCD